MNIGMLIICILGGAFGIAIVGGTVIGMIAVIIHKIYRKIRFGISLYD